MAAIVLITGPPGAGKSTVGRGVAEHFPRSAHLKVDDLRELMVNGFEPPGEWTDEAEAQFQRARGAAIHLAHTYAADGIVFVIDDVCVPWHFTDHYAALRSDPSAVKVALKPTFDVLERRIEARGGPWDEFFLASGAARWAYDALDVAPLDGWSVLDTSHQTAEETVAAVLAVVMQAANGDPSNM